MGRNNKQRRAAKKRRKATRRATRTGRRAEASAHRRTTAPPDVSTLLLAATHSWEVDPAAHETLLGQLESLAADGAPVLAVAGQRMDLVLEGLWQHGWTPVDVVHITSRRLTAAHRDIVRDAILDDGRRRAKDGDPPHDRWQAQLDLLADDPAPRLPGPPAAPVRLMVSVLAMLSRLPAVPPVMPRPDQALVADTVSVGRMDQRMLARVRRLLAKAESTDYDEEAEALTAKAQELITRHAIADALLHTPDDTGEPSTRRVQVDNPYPDAKASLLSVIADANRCEAVHSPDLGWVTVIGYESDLDAVELLGASLLAQASHAMARQGSRRGHDGRSTTRSFRRSFLYGFAARIGERLAAAADGEVLATGAERSRLLPVLAARDDRVRSALAQAFPNAERRATQISNPTGWSAGQAAADLADLGATDRRLRG